MARTAQRKKLEPRDWRWYLAEFIVVMAGVLGALGAQQAVEALQTRRDVAETRQAIHGEIASNAMRAKVMIAENTCGAGIRPKVLAWLDGGPRPATGALAMMLPMNSTVWDTVNDKGVADMPLAEQLSLAEYYTLIRLYNENENRRRDAGLRYAAFGFDRLSAEQIGRLREAVNGAEVMRAYQIRNARRLLDFASQLKIEPRAVDADMQASLARYCQQTGVPLAL